MSAFDGLGEGLRRLRARRGLRQSDLSERSRISKPQISKIERGVQKPSVETLDRLLEALPATLRELDLALAEARAPGARGGSRPAPRVSAAARRGLAAPAGHAADPETGQAPGHAAGQSPEVVFRAPPGLAPEERSKLAEVAESFGEFLYLVGERAARVAPWASEGDEARS